MASHLLLQYGQRGSALSAPARRKDGMILPAVVGAGSICKGPRTLWRSWAVAAVDRPADNLPQEASHVVACHGGEAGHHLQETGDMLQVARTVPCCCQVGTIQRHGCRARRGWREDTCRQACQPCLVVGWQSMCWSAVELETAAAGLPGLQRQQDYPLWRSGR